MGEINYSGLSPYIRKLIRQKRYRSGMKYCISRSGNDMYVAQKLPNDRAGDWIKITKIPQKYLKE